MEIANISHTCSGDRTGERYEPNQVLNDQRVPPTNLIPLSVKDVVEYGTREYVELSVTSPTRNGVPTVAQIQGTSAYTYKTIDKRRETQAFARTCTVYQ